MPLNPILYGLLTSVFGRPPRISNQGEAFSYDVINTPRGPRMKARGEQYTVCCPDCGDTRHRLYFHHRFGTKISDPRFPGALTDLCFCQNEQLKKPKWYALLHTQLSDPAVGVAIQMASAGAHKAPHEVPPMGEVVPLRQLPNDHQAILYLRGRHYDPLYLSDVYGTCLMVHHPNDRINNLTAGRIGFPFLIDGKLVTWQARLAYDLPKGAKFPPKWYFPPGSKHPWGVDIARQYRVCCLAEGVLSAVNFGPAGVAIGGKTLTYLTKQRLLNTWDNFFVALDPDAGVARKDKTQIDYQKRLIDELQAEGKNAVGAVWDPTDLRDPGDLGPLGCHELIRRSAPSFLELLPYFGG